MDTTSDLNGLQPCSEENASNNVDDVRFKYIEIKPVENNDLTVLKTPESEFGLPCNIKEISSSEGNANKANCVNKFLVTSGKTKDPKLFPKVTNSDMIINSGLETLEVKAKHIMANLKLEVTESDTSITKPDVGYAEFEAVTTKVEQTKRNAVCHLSANCEGIGNTIEQTKPVLTPTAKIDDGDPDTDIQLLPIKSDLNPLHSENYKLEFNNKEFKSEFLNQDLSVTNPDEKSLIITSSDFDRINYDTGFENSSGYIGSENVTKFENIASQLKTKKPKFHKRILPYSNKAKSGDNKTADLQEMDIGYNHILSDAVISKKPGQFEVIELGSCIQPRYVESLRLTDNAVINESPYGIGNGGPAQYKDMRPCYVKLVRLTGDDLHKSGLEFSDKTNEKEIRKRQEISSTRNKSAAVISKLTINSANSNLNDHRVEVHNAKVTIYCTVCKKQFRVLKTLKHHYCVHIGDRPFSCINCRRTFDRWCLLKLHETVHGEKQFTCVECGAQFTTQYRLNLHKQRHSAERPFLCDECGKMFKSRSELKSHRYLHGSKSFDCADCGKRFTHPNSFRDHQLTHSGEKTFSCPECGKTFRLRRYLTKHYRMHSDGRTYSCDDCGKQFYDKSRFKTHLLIHGPKESFSCELCHKKYSNIYSCRMHQRMHTQSDKKTFSCTECGKKFASSYVLKAHFRVHSDKREFSCRLCDSTYKHRESLRKHQHRHSNETSFPCHGSKTKFRSFSLLMQHKAVKFACSVCGKKFPSQSRLNRHGDVHIQMKSVQCNECGKMFKTLRHLRRHLKIHPSRDLIT